MESGRILVVDDEIDILKLLCDFLSECGYTVKGCRSGKESLSVLREHSFDLILTDLVVPDMDGITIMQEAFKIAPGILGIIISGKGSVQTAVNAMKAGAFDYILKPPDIEMLRQVLSRAIGVKRLQQAEKKYRSIFENSIGGIFQASPEGNNLTANYALARIFGYDSPEDLITNLGNAKEHFSAAPWNRPEFIGLIRKNDVVTGFESRVYRKDGSRIWVSVNAIAVRDMKGKLLYYEGTIEDITERKRSEDELKRSREQLRYLSAYLESAREKERIYIAREIHDELGQILTSMKMDLRWLSGKVNTDQQHLLTRIQSITDLVDVAVKTVQRISAELRPRFLDDLGLVAAVEWQLEEFRNHTGIRCDLTCEPDDMNLEQDTATALYRIIQETLTNIVRHARATRVTVHLRQNGETIILEVRDNGKGITEEQIANPKSYGLTGIRERTYLLGGDIRITGMHERGTTVLVTIPLKKECTVI